MATQATAADDTLVVFDNFDVRNLLNSARLPLAKADIDTTTFGNEGDAESIVGMRSASFSMEGFWKGDLASAQEIIRPILSTPNKAGIAKKDIYLLYSGYGGRIGSNSWMMRSRQNTWELSSPINGAIMLSGGLVGDGGVRYGPNLISLRGAETIGTNPIQQIDFGLVPDGTDIEIGWDGDTVVITPDMSAADIEDELEGLADVGVGGVIVSGVLTQDSLDRWKGVLTLDFGVASPNAALPPLITDNSLVTVTVIQNGGPIAKVEVIDSDTNFAVNDGGATTTRGITIQGHILYAEGANKTMTLSVTHSDLPGSGFVPVKNRAGANIVIPAITKTGRFRFVTEDKAEVKRYVRAEATAVTGKFVAQVAYSRYGKVLASH